MNVAMMQPTFLPWTGYFELISKAEKFIILDDFQFSVQSYHQRTRLFIDKARIAWYTVPVRKDISFGKPLNVTRINEDLPWRKKMARCIEQNYGKAPYFKELYPQVSEWLLKPADSLSAQNVAFIKLACEILGWQKEIIYSSQYPSTLKRSARVLDLLRRAGAKRYLCARGAFEYMKAEGLFPVNDIEVVFQNHHPKPYPQVGSPAEFVPYLSILDALFNVDPARAAELANTGTTKWLTWQEMAKAAGEQKENLDEN